MCCLKHVLDMHIIYHIYTYYYVSYNVVGYFAQCSVCHCVYLHLVSDFNTNIKFSFIICLFTYGWIHPKNTNGQRTNQMYGENLYTIRHPRQSYTYIRHNKTSFLRVPKTVGIFVFVFP